MRVLIVDDEPPARERLKRLLEEIDGCELAGEAATARRPSRSPCAWRPTWC